MSDFQPMTREEVDDCVCNTVTHERLKATVRDREARLRRAVKACRRVSSPCEEPSVCLTGDYHKGLMCGVEDRGFQARGYDAAEYGFGDGVDRALEWVQGECSSVLAENADLMKGESPCGS